MKRKISYLTEVERAASASAVNRYGSGQHPVACAENLEFFAANYVAECLKQAIPNFSVKYASSARVALEKLS